MNISLTVDQGVISGAGVQIEAYDSIYTLKNATTGIDRYDNNHRYVSNFQ